MSDEQTVDDGLTDEERALLASADETAPAVEAPAPAEKKTRAKKPKGDEAPVEAPAPAAATVNGPGVDHPARQPDQFEVDGWGDTPLQMRG